MKAHCIRHVKLNITPRRIEGKLSMEIDGGLLHWHSYIQFQTPTQDVFVLKLLETWLSKTQTRARLVQSRALTSKHILLKRAFLSQNERLGWRPSAIIQVLCET